MSNKRRQRRQRRHAPPPTPLQLLQADMQAAQMLGMTREQLEQAMDAASPRLWALLRDLSHNNPILAALLLVEAAAQLCNRYPDTDMPEFLRDVLDLRLADLP